ncbi:MAG: hypothetical protein KGJ57_13270 [Sphingomonadales bacterium]|nr:hypothetical protein [Sphingomonadales bacterium]MDE2170383.1 hypothetical protein [Sphingomonadales bacterium]
MDRPLPNRRNTPAPVTSLDGDSRESRSLCRAASHGMIVMGNGAPVLKVMGTQIIGKFFMIGTDFGLLIPTQAS